MALPFIDYVECGCLEVTAMMVAFGPARGYSGAENGTIVTAADTLFKSSCTRSRFWPRSLWDHCYTSAARCLQVLHVSSS